MSELGKRKAEEEKGRRGERESQAAAVMGDDLINQSINGSIGIVRRVSEGKGPDTQTMTH